MATTEKEEIWSGEEMIEYTVDIEMEAPKKADLQDTLIKLDEELESTKLIGPAAAANLVTNTVSVLSQVEAANPSQAITTAVTQTASVLGFKSSEAAARTVAVSCEPYEDPGLKELVTKAEIARRLDVSDVRIHQLAQRPDFPQASQQIDGDRSLYKWGHVVVWDKRRKAHAKPGRPKRRRASAAA